MKKLLLILLLVFPSTAHAVVLVTPDGQPAPPKWQKWVTSMGVPSPPGKVILHVGEACPDTEVEAGSSCAEWDGQIYMSPSHINSGFRIQRYVFRHELGHVWDHRVLTDLDREEFRAMTNTQGLGWFDPALEHDRQPGEMLAETYSTCGYFHETLRARWYMGDNNWTPTTKQLNRVCDWFRSKGGWRMTGVRVHP